MVQRRSREGKAALPSGAILLEPVPSRTSQTPAWVSTSSAPLVTRQRLTKKALTLKQNRKTHPLGLDRPNSQEDLAPHCKR